MPNIWLSIDGEATTLSIDDLMSQFTVEARDRNFQQIPLFANNSFITGFGEIKPMQITFTKKYKQDAIGWAWNDIRNNLLYFWGLPKYKFCWLNITDAYGNTYKTQIYGSNASQELYNSLKISGDNTFTFFCVTSYWQAASATSTSLTLTSNQLQLWVINNTGNTSTAPQFTFVPSTTTTSLQVQLAVGYGFTLTSSWVNGTTVLYNCANSLVYINGNLTGGLQSAGSSFNLAPGNNTLYVYGNSGTITCSYNARVI